jgi:hypothetical protein
MDYLWLPHQVRFYATSPAQPDQDCPTTWDKPVSILWVPIILLVAVLCIPLPFPTGLPLLALALSLFLNRSRRARVYYVRAKRRLTPGGMPYAWFDRIDGLLRVKRRRAGRS